MESVASVRRSAITRINLTTITGGHPVRLANSMEVLRTAIDRGFAVPFVNTRVFPVLKEGRFVGPSSVRSVIMAMHELKAPIAFEIAQSEMKYCDVTGDKMVRHITEEAAKARLDMPIVIHFDHGADRNKMEVNLAAGFTSIAFDGGKCETEADLYRQASEWVDYAHPRGISVEGEMETIGGMMATNPDKAFDFVSKTGVDILVVAFPGREHGAKKGESTLDEGILSSVRAAIPMDVALNLHGGSGYTYEQLSRAVQLGVTKVNYATEVMRAMLKGTRFEQMLIDLANAEREPDKRVSNAKDARNSLVTLFSQPDWLNMGADEQAQIERAGAEEIMRTSRALGNVDTAKYYIG